MFYSLIRNRMGFQKYLKVKVTIFLILKEAILFSIWLGMGQVSSIRKCLKNTQYSDQKKKKTKRKAIIDTILQRKLKFEQHQSHQGRLVYYLLYQKVLNEPFMINLLSISIIYSILLCLYFDLIMDAKLPSSELQKTGKKH